MSSPPHPVGSPSLRAVLPWLCALPVLLASSGRAEAQVQGYGQTIDSPQQQRELDAGSGSPSSRNSMLDATNPIDLMNRLRRASAFDNATPPSDAIDAALRDFDSQPQPQVQPRSPGSGLIQAP